MRIATDTRRVAFVLRLVCLTLAACAWAAAQEQPVEGTVPVPHGRRETINGCTVVSVDGTPAEMGTAYGTLLRATIQRVVRDLITEGICADPEARANLLAGSRIMERHQPKEFLDELRAMAPAAGVEYQDLLLLQYFGDVARCTSGAGSSPLCTREKICLVGRNLDYYDNGVGEYASVLVYHRPQGRIPFVTVTWAGIANGWTLLNERGVVVSNNTSFGGRSNSLEGISTCYLLRYVAERADGVEEGIRLVRAARRSCGTAMLVASGRPPGGAVLEFDHEALAVRRPEDGFVGAANGFLKLYQGEAGLSWWPSSRIGTARGLALARKGEITFADNIAGAAGVPIYSMNLHCATIDATNLRLKVAMGRIPACDLPFRAFRLTERGLVGDPAANENASRRRPRPWWDEGTPEEGP